MSMTFDAWDRLGDLADLAKMNRSEVLEILIRVAQKDGTDLKEERLFLLDQSA